MVGKITKNALDKGTLMKADDYKLAIVTLQAGQSFEFPDLKIEVSINCSDFQGTVHLPNLEHPKNITIIATRLF